MADRDLPVLKEARDEARRVLALRPVKSVEAAAKVTGAGLAAVAGMVGALVALREFSVAWLLALLALAVLCGVATWVVQEFERLAQQADALRRVLDSEKTYEVLLADVRTERDNAVAQRDSLVREREMLVLASYQRATPKNPEGSTGDNE